MWRHVIVVLAPALQLLYDVAQTEKDFDVQALIAEAPVE
jgi:hypothetical protein